MPRALPAPVRPVPAGVDPAYAAPTVDGDAVPAGCYVAVRNGSAADITVTAVTGGTTDGLAVADVPVVVPAGGERLIGPFGNRDLWVQPSGTTAGLVHLDYSAVASVTRAVVAVR